MRCWLPLLGLAALLLLAAGLRLYHLQQYVLSHYDEGVYLESLVLMTRGYLPFRDFFSSQGPLFLSLLYPFALLGGPLGPRLGVALFSLAGIAAVAGTAWRRHGPVAALAAVLILALSPRFLWTSRLALAEVPAVSLAAAAVWLAGRAPRRGWLAAAAVALAAALLVKPLAAGAAGAVLAQVVAARMRERAWRALALDVALLGGVALVVLAAATVPFGVVNVYNQFILFHVDVAALVASPDPASDNAWPNLAFAAPSLLSEGVGLYLLAGLALACTLAHREDLPAALWLVGTIAVLGWYTPFYLRYLSFLLPPLAFLAGSAAAKAFAPPTRLAPVLAQLGVAAYALALPSLLAADVAIAEAPVTADRLRESRAAADLAAATLPNEFVATDNQRIAILANRLVAPPLVDTSMARAKTGSLDATDATRALDDYQVAALVWWYDNRFGKLRGFKNQVKARFTLARSYPEENSSAALYVRGSAGSGLSSRPTR